MRIFDPSRVALVDSVGTSRFVRGPFPLLEDGSFALSGIGAAVGLDLMKSRPVVVSLIDSTGEHPMLKAELASLGLPDLWGPEYWPPYLRRDYDAGELHSCVIRDEASSLTADLMWWPIEGVGPGQDPEVFLSSPGWDLCGLVDRIVELMHDKSRTVYVHCSLGADRTGAVVACYMMKFRGLDVEAALSFTGAQTPAGLPNRDYVALIRAYADRVRTV